LSRLPSRCCLLVHTPLKRGPLCLEVPGAAPFFWFKLRLQHCSVLFPCSLRVIDLCFLVVPAIVACMSACELELRQAQIRVALRTLTQSLRACRKQAQSEERCPAGVWRALEAMLLLSKGDFECARVFCRSRVDAELFDSMWQTWEARLRLWWEGLSQEQKICLIEGPATPQRKHALQTAQKYLEEFNMHRWLREQNLTKKLAPCSAAVVARGALEDTVPNRLFASCATHKAKLQKLRRWRWRWKVRFGRLGCRSKMQGQALRDKVALHTTYYTRPSV